MTRVLASLANSPSACLFSIALGVIVMLSVTNVDPTNLTGILGRQAAGGIFLLAPALAFRIND